MLDGSAVDLELAHIVARRHVAAETSDLIAYLKLMMTPTKNAAEARRVARCSRWQAAHGGTIDSRKHSLEVELYRSAKTLSKSNKSLYSYRVCRWKTESPLAMAWALFDLY